jgi:hypothetical protein
MFWQSKKSRFLSDEQRSGLGVALNEADFLGLEVDPQRRIAAATFRILTLPTEGSTPSDRRVQILFRPVGRVVASLRNGAWNDPNAEVVPLAVEDLLTTVQSFGGLPVYGWEFFDIHKKQLRKLRGRLSLDWKQGDDGHSHSIALFQSPSDRILDLLVWFDELMIRDPEGNVIPLESFIADGKQWWDAFHEGDEQTKGFGMAPLKEPSE